MKKFFGLFALSLLSGATTLVGYKYLENKNYTKNGIITTAQPNYAHNTNFGAENIDFTQAAEKGIHTVVHVKNVSVRTVYNPIFEFFYGSRGGAQQQEQVGTGSGVIISEDGYIVTNNHVIQDATELEVTLNNNKSYKAKLIGTDTKMDIALLKIDADEKLPFASFADSDQVKIGEWVLAIGNPYNLNSTVTAGIVSAKARNLDTRGIQSFIQTDAAVNPGNSGGALINTQGNLIGINTMISSPTGSYAGYSFAVPSNIARKIVEDIMEFGGVQRGNLGVEGTALTGSISKQLNTEETDGFYIKKIYKNSGADKAGLKVGDVIKKLDNQKISNDAEWSGFINTKRPNDKVSVTVLRNGKTLVVPVTIMKNDVISTDLNGLVLENITTDDKKKFGINGGVKIKEVSNERFKNYENVLAGSIILSIDGKSATDVETVSKIIMNKEENESYSIRFLARNGQVFNIYL